MALLDLAPPMGEQMQLSQRAAIEDIININNANERKERPQSAPALLEWIEKQRQPWRFGVKNDEWRFKGFRAQRDLAKELLMLRSNAGNVAPAAKTLLSYYRAVSDGELEHALKWKPIHGRKFFEAFFSAIGHSRVNLLSSNSRETRFLILDSDSLLEVELSVIGGILSYSIFNFFENPVATSSYEALFGIGTGEWDRLEDGMIHGSARALAEILGKHLLWKKKMQA